MDWLSLCFKGYELCKKLVKSGKEGNANMKYVICALAVLLVVSVCGLIALKKTNTTLQDTISELQLQINTQNTLINTHKANEERLQSSLDSYKAKVSKQFDKVAIPSKSAGESSALDTKIENECEKFIDDILKAYYE